MSSSPRRSSRHHGHQGNGGTAKRKATTEPGDATNPTNLRARNKQQEASAGNSGSTTPKRGARPKGSYVRSPSSQNDIVSPMQSVGGDEARALRSSPRKTAGRQQHTSSSAESSPSRSLRGKKPVKRKLDNGQPDAPGSDTADDPADAAAALKTKPSQSKQTYKRRKRNNAEKSASIDEEENNVTAQTSASAPDIDMDYFIRIPHQVGDVVWVKWTNLCQWPCEIDNIEVVKGKLSYSCIFLGEGTTANPSETMLSKFDCPEKDKYIREGKESSHPDAIKWFAPALKQAEKMHAKLKKAARRKKKQDSRILPGDIVWMPCGNLQAPAIVAELQLEQSADLVRLKGLHDGVLVRVARSALTPIGIDIDAEAERFMPKSKSSAVSCEDFVVGVNAARDLAPFNNRERLIRQQVDAASLSKKAPPSPTKAAAVDSRALSRTVSMRTDGSDDDSDDSDDMLLTPAFEETSATLDVEVNDVVWARPGNGQPFWPAKVVKAPHNPEAPITSKNDLSVVLFRDTDDTAPTTAKSNRYRIKDQKAVILWSSAETTDLKAAAKGNDALKRAIELAERYCADRSYKSLNAANGVVVDEPATAAPRDLADDAGGSGGNSDNVVMKETRHERIKRTTTQEQFVTEDEVPSSHKQKPSARGRAESKKKTVGQTMKPAKPKSKRKAMSAADKKIVETRKKYQHVLERQLDSVRPRLEKLMKTRKTRDKYANMSKMEQIDSQRKLRFGPFDVDACANKVVAKIDDWFGDRLVGGLATFLLQETLAFLVMDTEKTTRQKAHEFLGGIFSTEQELEEQHQSVRKELEVKRQHERDERQRRHELGIFTDEDDEEENDSDDEDR